MKKLHKLIVISYLRPFVATFFIVSFILSMIFLSKYIDELVGKGLEWYTILQLLGYNFAVNVPLALPLAILLASIMTFGNLGEQYELVAIKASGISLSRAMVPLVFVMVLLSIAAFYFSNIIMPRSFLKMGSLLYDVRQKKAAFAIPEGVFYNDLEGYSIRVTKKDPDGKTLYDLMIYDHMQGNGNMNVVLAKKGEMFKSDDDRYLVLNLYDGVRYSENPGDNGYNDRQRQVRIRFKEYGLKFDLSGFNLSRTKEELFKDHYQMLNVRQLLVKEDSLQNLMALKQRNLDAYIEPTFLLYKPHSNYKTIKPIKNLSWKNKDVIMNILPATDRLIVVDDAINSMRNVKSYLTSAKEEATTQSEILRKHMVEFHRKFTLSFACIVLFFIGAPMGAIVRKGGLGLPVVISILFFLVFHVLSISGEKFAKQGKLEPYQGMWMATLVLVPIGIFLTYKAATDSAIFDAEKYQRFFKRLFSKKENQ
ncbi:LptF/LptG family permease [Solitalea sp. MAHUQ-68]|uniref:LptF/LptG family permease n=1 Tax=Solitalea agri TaxID=2953739 RepID=A0A9X2F098_9SPHI|nr:LptF/LptG family permease [Solitalea agri]MCO4291861.1 LptF/LptG family permease [Solitalea agri]